ncbi:MAG: respiratory nitrate reductase subunit gamma [Deltaproteobacteria bacterium]|nr:respiratory nitrate reductase subunit gamma [Deltaproteobacteria bacterium]MBW2306613.1 respiratory nitrate reductase subunit gamma [Deltaproteobacteria bacterium]
MLATNFIGKVLPYLTAIVFIAGMTYRINRWNRAKAAKMTLFPGSVTSAEKWKRIIKEVLIFEGLFQGNKPLWVGTWVFHAALALIIVGHSRVVADFPLIWNALGMDRGDVDTMSTVMGGSAGVIILGMGLYLLFRRFAVQRVREISDAEDYFVILLILAIIITGDIMRFGNHFDLKESREYFAALFSFRAAHIPSNAYFLLHFLLGQLLIMYIPFSKFLHIPGIFYSKSLIYQE